MFGIGLWAWAGDLGVELGEDGLKVLFVSLCSAEVDFVGSANIVGMNVRTGAVSLVFFVWVVAAGPRAHARPVTLDDVVDPGRLVGAAPESPAWSADGRWLAFAWANAPSAGRQLWVVDRQGQRKKALTRALKGAKTVSTFDWLSPTVLVVLRDSDVWRVDVDSGETRRLTRSAVAKHSLAASPDGRRVAYVQAGDVWTVSAAGGSPRRLTQLAVRGMEDSARGIYARMDREVGAATWPSATPILSWSSDSRTLAVHVVDRRRLRRVPFPSYLGSETQTILMRRPYPGDLNETRTIGLIDMQSARLEPVLLPDPTRMLVVNLAWSPTSGLLIDRMSDDNTVREVYVVTPSASPRLVWRDQRKTRIYTEAASAWARDGRTILLTADVDDRYRVYEIKPGRKGRHALTPKEVDAHGPAHSLAAGDLIYTAGAPTPAERHAWRVRPGAEPARLTRRPGTHRVVVAPDATRLATVVSDDITPPELWIVPFDGSPDVQVTRGETAELTAAKMVRPAYVRFAGPDRGDTLHAKVWRPADRQRAPVLFGPIYVNTVRNRWDGRFGLLKQLLVERGYAVVQVDVRGSTGYGRAFREKFLFQWGAADLEDLAAAKAWFAEQPWADTTRTGVFGSSYGGLVGVYALLTRPGLFDAAVAGAPATDPHFFGSDDIAITRRPSTAPGAFARGAARYASQLQGHLMIIHGLADAVVPFKTTAVLADALMKAGKDFELVVAPGANHRWTAKPHHARYLLNKLLQHFDRYVPVR